MRTQRYESEFKAFHVEVTHGADLGKLFDEFCLNPILERQVCMGAAFAGTGQANINDVVKIIDEFDVTAVSLEHRAKRFERFFDFESHGSPSNNLSHESASGPGFHQGQKKPGRSGRVIGIDVIFITIHDREEDADGRNHFGPLPPEFHPFTSLVLVRDMFSGIEVEDALAILATFERILSLKADIDLRLQFHVAAFARAIGSRNDRGEAGTFFADESVAFEDFGFKFFREIRDLSF